MMNNITYISERPGTERERLAIRILAILTTHQQNGETLGLGALARQAGVSKTSLQKILRALDRQGMIDAQRMTLTLAGFAIGAAVLRDAAPESNAA